MAISRTAARAPRSMRGVNAPIASLRWRLCAGGSIRMIEGALAAIALIVPGPRRSARRARAHRLVELGALLRGEQPRALRDLAGRRRLGTRPELTARTSGADPPHGAGGTAGPRRGGRTRPSRDCKTAIATIGLLQWAPVEHPPSADVCQRKISRVREHADPRSDLYPHEESMDHRTLPGRVRCVLAPARRRLRPRVPRRARGPLK